MADVTHHRSHHLTHKLRLKENNIRDPFLEMCLSYHINKREKRENHSSKNEESKLKISVTKSIKSLFYSLGTTKTSIIYSSRSYFHVL